MVSRLGPCLFRRQLNGLLRSLAGQVSSSRRWLLRTTVDSHGSCDGTFSENCDSSRDYTNIAGVCLTFFYQSTIISADYGVQLLTAQGASDTLAFMQEVKLLYIYNSSFLRANCISGVSSGWISTDRMNNFGR